MVGVVRRTGGVAAEVNANPRDGEPASLLPLVSTAIHPSARLLPVALFGIYSVIFTASGAFVIAAIISASRSPSLRCQHRRLPSLGRSRRSSAKVGFLAIGSVLPGEVI